MLFLKSEPNIFRASQIYVIAEMISASIDVITFNISSVQPE